MQARTLSNSGQNLVLSHQQKKMYAKVYLCFKPFVIKVLEVGF